jgi:hypothetical protein
MTEIPVKDAYKQLAAAVISTAFEDMIDNRSYEHYKNKAQTCRVKANHIKAKTYNQIKKLPTEQQEKEIEKIKAKNRLLARATVYLKIMYNSDGVALFMNSAFLDLYASLLDYDANYWRDVYRKKLNGEEL